MARTTLDLDEDLLTAAQEASGSRTKTAVIEEALREYVNKRRRERLIARMGKGDIDMTLKELKEMRRRSIRRFDEAD